MADLFLDEFNGAPGTLVGHVAGDYVWEAPFVSGQRLLLSGFGSVIPPFSGSGDAQIQIFDFASADEYGIELTFGGPLADLLEIEYGVQSVGDLTPGNWYINISNTGCEVRWYTEGSVQSFTWPDTIIDGTTVRFHFRSNEEPRLITYYEGEQTFSYGASDRVMDAHVWRMSASSDSNLALMSMRAYTADPPAPSEFWTELVGTTATVGDPAPPPEA